MVLHLLPGYGDEPLGSALARSSADELREGLERSPDISMENSVAEAGQKGTWVDAIHVVSLSTAGIYAVTQVVIAWLNRDGRRKLIVKSEVSADGLTTTHTFTGDNVSADLLEQAIRQSVRLKRR